MLTYKSTSLIISCLHAVVTSRLCEYTIYTEELLDIEKFGSPMTPLQYKIFIFIFGYLFYDTILLMLHRKDAVLTLHHLIGIATILSVFMTSRSGPDVIFCTWLGIFPNFSFTVRYYFKQYSQSPNSRIAKINDRLLSFQLIARFVVGFFLMFVIVIGNSIFFLKFLYIGMFLVNLKYLGRIAIDGIRNR